MRTISTSVVPDSQVDELERAAASLSPEVRAVVLAVGRCIRGGDDLIVADEEASLTPAEASKRLGMSRTHLYKILDRGDIPSFHVGRDRRIKLRDLVAFDRARDADRRELAERFAHRDSTRSALLDELSDIL